MVHEENADAQAQRRRVACDECRTKKLKCTGEQPCCSRCVTKSITCVYALQKPMGRPRKRRLDSEDHQQQQQQPQEPEPQPASTPGQWPPKSRLGSFSFGTYLSPNADIQQWPDLQGWDANQQPLDFSTPNEATLPELTEGSSESSPNDDTNNVEAVATPNGHLATAPAMSCACLSTMYLALSTLQSMDDFAFPASVHTLREAVGSAWDVLHCQECPKRFLTGMHNVQLLGLFLVSISERYAKVIDAIDQEEARASDRSELKSFRLADLTAASSHLHSGGNLMSPGTSFSLDLAPTEWKKLAKKVVKAEVKGTSDGCCPCFVSLMDQMEVRQKHFHEHPPLVDGPKPYSRDKILQMNREHAKKGGEFRCLHNVDEARKIVDNLDFD